MHAHDLSASFLLPDEVATRRAGEILAPAVTAGMSVWLEGELGAGKTCLVRSLLCALGHRGAVKSPTYSLVEVYVVSSLYLYHFDFYRFESQEEFLDAGFAEHFNEDSLCLVEWPQRASGCLPPPDLRLCLHHAGVGRVFEAVGLTAKGQACVLALQKASSAGAFSIWPVAASSSP